MTSRSESYHAAMASPPRRSVLNALLASPDPLDAATVAERVGLHVTTARFHLDQLVEAGLARRRPSVEQRRGRPRMLYRVASPDDARRDPIAMGRLEESIAHVALTKVLISGFGRDLGPTREAARSAGYALTAPGGVLEPPVEPLSEARTEETTSGVEERQLDALEGHLDRLGFDPERDDDALRVDLWRCPFLELARERPEVVCSVHLGLASGVLETVGGPIAADRLRPFVGREHCVLELRRAPVPSTDG